MASDEIKIIKDRLDFNYKQQTKKDNINYFISILGIMQMELQYHGSTEAFFSKFNIILEDYEKIADAAFREGDPMPKCLLIGLRTSFSSSGDAADKIQSEVDKLRLFWSK